MRFDLWARKRWVIVTAAVVAVALIVAGVIVALTRSTLSDADRRAIGAFEQERMPSVQRAIDVHAQFGPLVEAGARSLQGSLPSTRRDLERARRELTEGAVPPILKPALAEFLTGIGFSLQGLAVIEESFLRGAARVAEGDLRRFRDAWSSAKPHFDQGVILYGELRCDAGVPRACEAL